MNPNTQVIPQKSRFALNVKNKIPDKIEANEPDKIKPNDVPILDNNKEKEKEIVENKEIVDYGEERFNLLFKNLDLLQFYQVDSHSIYREDLLIVFLHLKLTVTFEE